MKLTSKFYCLGDLHIHDWSTFNQDLYRTKMLLNWFSKLVVKASNENAKVLIAGDLFHNPSHMSNELFRLVNEYFHYMYQKVSGEVIYCISGNHDRDGDDARKSPSWVKTFSELYPFIRCIDFTTVGGIFYEVIGIPYLKDDVGLENAMKVVERSKHDVPRILVIHKELPGAEDTNGMRCENKGKQTKLSTFFQHFDYVVCGHIHKPQLLRKNILMCGSPMQMRTCDMGTDMGYWVLDRDGFTFEKAELPEFRYEGESGKNFDIYIKRKVVKTKEKDGAVANEIKLNDWSSMVDEYTSYIGEKGKKRKKLLKDLLNDAEIS